MHKNRFGYSVRWGLVSVFLWTMIDSTIAGSFTRGCAARDLQVLMLIEERESSHAVPAEKLSDAMLLVLEARMVCYEGRVMDAMALYDSIAQSLAPGPLYPLDGDEGRYDCTLWSSPFASHFSERSSVYASLPVLSAQMRRSRKADGDIFHF
jgi:hypothetical protein